MPPDFDPAQVATLPVWLEGVRIVLIPRTPPPIAPKMKSRDVPPTQVNVEFVKETDVSRCLAPGEFVFGLAIFRPSNHSIYPGTV